MDLVRGLCVSSCGDKVWGCHIKKKVKNKYISRLMMYDFKKKSHFFYDYEHQNLIVSVLVSEVFKLAISGGRDKTLVLHDLESGKMVKRLDMKYGNLRCLFDLGTAVAVGDWDSVRLLDLQTKEMGQFEVKAGGKFIQCMNLSIRGSYQCDNMTLLVGAEDSNKIIKIIIPAAIAKLGKKILEMQNQSKNTEKFIKKMILLENENKRLLEKNQRLKDKLKQEENGKVDTISKFEKKIMDLSNEVETQETIKEQFQEVLQHVKNQLTSCKKENEILVNSNQQQQQKLDDLNSQLRNQRNSNRGIPYPKISKTKSLRFHRKFIRLNRTTGNYPKRSKTFKKSSTRVSPKI